MTTENQAELASDSTAPRVEPHEPPFFTADLPGCGGRIGPDPAHFQVEEVPLYAASGEGEHVYVQIRKRTFTTPAMLRKVAEQARVDDRDIGYAGMKDKHAVTTQWISLPAKSVAPEAWQLPADIEVVSVTRHANKLRTGHLRGNRFRITLVNVPADQIERAQAIATRLKEQPLPNYFGAQRFGNGGEGLNQALQWVRNGAKSRKLPRFLTKLYPSVIQSEVFNRYLSARLRIGRDQLLLGEVVRLDNAGAMFVVEDVARELPRLQTGDIHLTGPMFGPKGRKAASDAEALEREIIAELGLSEKDLNALGEHAPGTRRDLFIRVEDLSIELTEANEVVVAFSLSSGSYATQVIREFTRGAFFDESSQHGDS